jgi:DNA polymerase-3 subunit alpha
MYLIFDTETTGRPANYNAPLTDSDNWPRLVQLAWQLHDTNGDLVEVQNYIVKPDGFEIPYSVVKIHGITTERAMKQGLPLEEVIDKFNEAVEKATVVAGHNIEFDINIVGAEYHRIGSAKPLLGKHALDTMKSTVDFCALPGGRGGKFKYPQLAELHQKLFGEGFDAAHNAAADVEATARCFLELIRIGIFSSDDLKITGAQLKEFILKNPSPVKAIGLNVQPYDPNDLKEDETPAEITDKQEDTPAEDAVQPEEGDEVPDFVHLHLHTQYSILDGLTNIKALARKAKDDGMKAVAITDHGTMFGVKEFHKVISAEGLKPIIGMEAYVAVRTIDKRERMDQKRYHLVLLVKNMTGYRNLMRLASISYSEGFYYKPRIDKNLLRQYSEGLIALSACLAGEIPNKIMEIGLDKAEEALKEYLDIFGDDFYIELQRHPATDPVMNQDVYKDQTFVNPELLKLAKKYNVKVVASNDVHFLNAEDYQAHDRLICLNTGKDIDDANRMRYTGQEWFKTRREMAALFADMPEVLANTVELAGKIEDLELNHKPIMPDFKIPEGFENEDDYLRHITYEGAKKRWGNELSDEVKERLDFELATIKSMGFPGYFLIVWDFLKAAREMGVIVGPGRGSAAGSAVAYCLKITDIDPLKYNLLFERFLNPDRISMPDIDIDFDDEGREKILEWVKNKYGSKRVAHIITFGSMAAKSSIRDVARVQKMPLGDADKLAKLVPERPGVSLKDAFKEVKELKDALTEGDDETRSVLDYAQKLEGSIRNTGTHACGIIIGRDDLDNYIPLSTVKDSTLDYATQYDGHHVEDIGLLKMDFLGLKTLSIIKDTIENIKISKGIELSIDDISLEDKETFELYSRGETLGLFQFESEGMRNHLKNLKPTKLDDLIAMNALYRPGPMDYIDDFIARKHGRQAITYDIPEMEEYLKETYGITVYQEQVMLLSRKLAGFTRGQSDSLRKAMGKKIKHMMDELKVEFMNGGEVRGHKKEVLEKVWKDWEAFAKYAFNKSHATCYTYVSFQTGYLKAHYPAEFMASVLSHNFKEISKLNFYLNECNRMNIKVLGPNINESYSGFTVNSKGEIRFGLAGIKGVGEAAVQAIIEERNENGPFTDVFDFVKRVNLRTVNKKTLESLTMVGAFDGLKNAHRAQFFYMEDENDTPFIEKILKFGAKFQENKNSNQISLFGDMEEVAIQTPDFPDCEPWSIFKQLKIEKDLLGFYLSGHPLDTYGDAIKFFAKANIRTLLTVLEGDKETREKNKDKLFSFAGIVTKAQVRESKNGSKFGIYTVEDSDASIDFFLFTENFLKYGPLMIEESFVFIECGFKTSFRDKEKLELRIDRIKLLETVVPDFTREVKVLIDLRILDDERAGEFVKAVKSSKGKSKLRIYLSSGNGTQLQMRSPKYQVDPIVFTEKLKALDFVEYKLN